MKLPEPSELSFNVAGLLKEPVGATRHYEFHEDALVLHEDMLARDLRGEVTLLRISSGVLAKGQVEAMVNVDCSRCLAEYTAKVEAPFTEEYRPEVSVVTGTPVQTVREGESEDDFFLIRPDHVLDLEEAVRQALVVNTPYAGLCREDCAGLCATCGKNLNEGSCDCARPTGDARLRGLALILDQLEDYEENQHGSTA